MYELVTKTAKTEIYADRQVVSMEFAFARIEVGKEGEKVLRQLHPFLKCRDALCSVLIASNIDKRIPDLYNLSYDPKEGYVDMSKLCLLVRYPEAAKKLQKAADFTNYLGKKARWKSTKVVKLNESYKDIYLVTGSRKWLSSPQLFSLFTLLLRIGVFIPLDENNYEERLKKPEDHFPACSDRKYLIRIWLHSEKLCLGNPITGIVKRNLDLFKDCYEQHKKSGNYSGFGHGGILTFVGEALNYKNSGLSIDYMRTSGNCLQSAVSLLELIDKKRKQMRAKESKKCTK